MAATATTLFTQCTHCSAVLQITVGQLREGAGKARCGTCEQVFDAIVNLREVDEMSDANSQRTTGTGSTADFSERSATDPFGTTFSGGAASADPGLGNIAETAPEPEFDLDPVWPLDDRGQTRMMPAFNDREADAELSRTAPKPKSAAAPSAASEGTRGAWFVGLSMLLLVVLVLQMMFFEPERVLTAFPQARPAVEALCQRLPCEVPPQRALGMFAFSSRSVKEHPQHANALEVRATLSNTASHGQPLPRIELVLFDERGTELAKRVFAPNEYLVAVDGAGETDIGAGEARDLALDVVTPSATATNFGLRVR